LFIETMAESLEKKLISVKRLGVGLSRNLGSIPSSGKRFLHSVGAHQPPVQWVPEDTPLTVKLPNLEADYSPPSGVEIKVSWSHTLTPQTSSLRDAQLRTGTLPSQI
jgi:hypothetical protein